MIQLRPYQQEAIDALFRYFERNDGSPIVVLPTGSGKSVIQAEFCRLVCTQWPQTRIMLVTHVKELLQQNRDKLLSLWPTADVGVYSAGIGSRDTGNQIIVAGIQSAWKKPHVFGHIDLVFVDECHLIPKNTDGTYRKFLAGLARLCPNVKVIGMTATPYRLGTGLLHKGVNTIFTDVAYEAKIRELVSDGYLCPLISKVGEAADLSGVKVSGGEYVKSQLQKAMNAGDLVERTVADMLPRLEGRKKWLVFCCGVEHAEHVTSVLVDNGIKAACVTGETSKGDRAKSLEQFASGEIKCLVNVNVLSTGFDAPDIDAIVMLRPTKSTGLYVQIVGRGMRPHPSKTNTLVLDYSGNIEEHGPIDDIRIVSKQNRVEKKGVKVCSECFEAVDPRLKRCPACGFEFPAETVPRQPTHADKAGSADIMSGGGPIEYPVINVHYRPWVKASTGKKSMRVDYMTAGKRFSEWICVEHEGRARVKAEQWFEARGTKAPLKVNEALHVASELPAPKSIFVMRDGEYFRVLRAVF